MNADAVAARADAAFEDTLKALGRYLEIPAISCDPHHAEDVRRLAARIRDDLEALGMQRARVLSLDDALPCVAAEWLGAGDGLPTVLIYGHLDLQPVKGEPWRTDPHTMVEKDGRVYARGSADDMGGWVSHLASIQAWMAEHGRLPVNVKLLIEGEEEIGSPNLERYMDAFPDAFASDVMVLTDCENPSTEIPGLTVSLRGLIEMEVTCEALEADGHSGLWGNMVPDVSLGLVKLVGRLVDEDGRPRIGLVEVDAARKAAAKTVPLSAEVIRGGAHLLPGVDPLPVRDRSIAEWMWWQPAITVVATTLPTPDRKKNALRTKASATLSVRLAPDQKAEDLYGLLEAELLRDPPCGVKVTVTPKGWNGEGWLYTPKGEAFEAADRAYVKAWGHELVQVGVGGSIPFVALFGRRYGDLPLILNGVMDPLTTAHGPNESMHLGVFRKAIAANVYLLDELSRVEL
ncbi:MAG: M20/M25/M40 family metallo-hydrolase [Alphaproteobacteria bacterium]|nr:M20/M25/M40 family metallo-hydrolase [Alphaproteobacteria bacterium]MCB9691533.1 M20/M25/M40 family metallo-hydrolase [Alphaproteobacteria bacterium]